MKKGPSTTANITFDIIQGTISDFGTATPLLSVTLQPGDFTQQYDPIAFATSAIVLTANTTYTGVLYSNAVDTQSTAYFIKKGNDDRFLQDENGNPAPGSDGNGDDNGDDTVPEPASVLVWCVLGLVGAASAWRSRRRRHA